MNEPSITLQLPKQGNRPATWIKWSPNSVTGLWEATDADGNRKFELDVSGKFDAISEISRKFTLFDGEQHRLKKATITAKKAIEALRAVVKGNEGFVYTPPNGLRTACVYVHNGEPSCVVGKALVHLGVPVKDVAFLDTCNHGDPISATALPGKLLDPPVTDEAASVFVAAQAEQDTQLTWGAALAAAEKVYARISSK